jgi:hypothetical protein
MSAKLQPFLISEFSTGLSTYLQPWVRPKDAFEPLVNAYTYRGVVNKRNGYIPFGNQLADTNPVMGLLNRIDELTGAISLIAVSTTNAYIYKVSGNTFMPLTAVGGSGSVFWKGTATGTIVIPTFWPNITPASVSITDGTSTLTFNAAGMQNSSPAGIFGSGSTINYTTGVVTIVFAGTTAGVSLTLTATLAGSYFTGNNTNFFNSVSWQPTDPTTFVSSVSYLYFTNNVDPITLFDGTNLSRPILYINSTNTDYITTALDVAVFQNRLLILRPTLNSTSNPLNQSIYFSAIFNPLNFINDVAGNGGQVTAATGDIIQCQEFLRGSIIVFLSNSTWLFRFTGSISDPFRFDRLTISKNVSSPYGSIAYDERATAVGSLGLIACDGVNVQRYDTTIIDYYETEMNEGYFGQTFGIRYDNLNQGWMLYVSNGTTNPIVGSGAPGSDSALIYNFAEQSWATYTFSVPMTCLGKFYSITGTTWAELPQSWDVTDTPWKSYSNQKLAPILLIGDVNGNVYWIDNEDAVTDNGNPIIPEITTTRWNPVLQVGQKTQFPYIDVYYTVVSTDPSNPVQLTLSFYVDNSDTEAFTSTLTLDGPISSEFAFKRVYCNLIGEFIKLDIDPNVDAWFQILGFIIWAKPAGRMTP